MIMMYYIEVMSHIFFLITMFMPFYIGRCGASPFLVGRSKFLIKLFKFFNVSSYYSIGNDYPILYRPIWRPAFLFRLTGAHSWFYFYIYSSNARYSIYSNIFWTIQIFFTIQIFCIIQIFQTIQLFLNIFVREGAFPYFPSLSSLVIPYHYPCYYSFPPHNNDYPHFILAFGWPEQIPDSIFNFFLN